MANSNLSVVLVGGREFTHYVLQYLIDSHWAVSGVVSRSKDDAADRVGYVSMADLCSREQIQFIKTNDISNESTRKKLKEINPDVALCCGWTQIIPESVLEIPKMGFLGVHASSLPEDRGGAPVNWQIIRGDDEVGVSLFYFVSEVDHGDILEQTTVPIEQRDDVATIYDKVTIATFDLLDQGLNSLANREADATPQSFKNATYLPQRKPEDGLINWNLPPRNQRNWIRAQTHPYPGAFTFYREQKLIVWDATIPEYQATSGEPGEILRVEQTQGIDVQTGDGVIRLKQIEIEGRPSMWADEAAARYDIYAGTVLGHPSHFPEWLYTGLRDADGGFQYKTNVSPGEPAEFLAVCCSHTSPQDIQIKVNFEHESFLKEEITVKGWDTVRIKVQPTSGSHTLQVIFELQEGRRYDTRYLKLYTPEDALD